VPSLFPIIAGPTASGKSALAVAIALHLRERLGLPAEVIAADSMQVYRGLDIGSAKPTLAERRGVPHRLIDVAEPTESFSVDRWLGMAEAEIARVRGAAGVGGAGGVGGVPIVVGGTHLYIKALLDGLFEGPEPDPALRAQLHAMDPRERRAELERVDPAAAARIHPNDARRTVRALEVFRQTGRPISAWQSQWDAAVRAPGGGRPDCVLVLLNWPTQELNRRINARVRSMMESGLLEEVGSLHAAGRLGRQAREGLGYKQLVEHIEGRMTLQEAVERIKIETRRFAKNQRTWLRRLRAARPGGGVLELEMAEISEAEALRAILRSLGLATSEAGYSREQPVAERGA
jgi:tRNA dimethylallyltransferase